MKSHHITHTHIFPSFCSDFGLLIRFPNLPQEALTLSLPFSHTRKQRQVKHESNKSADERRTKAKRGPAFEKRERER